MPNPTITYVLTNGTANDAGQVNTNFTDIIAALTDGTKDITSLSGTFTTISATNLTSTLLPTDATFDLGSTTKNFKNLYLDNGATHGGRVNFNAGSTSYVGSSADGATLSVAGFSTVSFNGDLRIYDASNTNYYSLETTASTGFDFDIQYNGTTQLRVDASAAELSGSGLLDITNFLTLELNTNISSGSTPVANTLYANTMVKCWGVFTTNGTASPTVNSGFNISSISAAGTTMVVTFLTPFSSSNYAVSGNAQNDWFTRITTSTTTMSINAYDLSTGALVTLSADSGTKIHFLAIGGQ